MTNLAARFRNREALVGYWMELDSPAVAERVAGLGYDYVLLDLQHGLLEYDGMLHCLQAIRAAGAEGMVRVLSNNAGLIGKALDAGAAAIIVPLVNTAEEAAAAVAAGKYPPRGVRSYGPLRSALQYGPVPADAEEQTAVIVMIETRQGLENVEEICATPGLAGVYVGPADLAINLGAAYPGDPAVFDEWSAGLETVIKAAEAAGIASGLHCFSGADAGERAKQGFTFTSVACDIDHLTAAARSHLEDWRQRG